MCATRNALSGGTKALNGLCQKRFNVLGDDLVLWSADFEQRALTEFRTGDPVICTKNHWELDLQNGSLGVLTAVEAPVDD